MTPHLTDDQLIAHLYGLGAEDRHLKSCAECQARLSQMQLRRASIDDATPDQDVSFEFLAAQRRRIYERISRPERWWSHPGWFHVDAPRWATAGAGLLVLAGGLLFFESHRVSTLSNNVSDAQLVQDVSRMAADSEPPATAPLQALFEE